MRRYIIITPVKNEEKYIEQTLTSIKNQTLQPQQWIIVNDGSTDKTKEIILSYAKSYLPICLFDRQQSEQKRKRGRGVVDAFYVGFDKIQNDEFDYIVKLDGDLKLPVDFFEKIIYEFEKNPKLGIASGVSYIKKKGRWLPERAAKGYTYGETKVYRKECFQDIGGLIPFMGWDGIDHIKAVMHGWNASSFQEIIFYHLRPEGKGTGMLKANYERGLGCYFMGYHPIFLVLRAIKKMKSYPFVIGGIVMMFGYFKCSLAKGKKIDDPNFITFLRKNQINRILSRNPEYV